MVVVGAVVFVVAASLTRINNERLNWVSHFLLYKQTSSSLGWRLQGEPLLFDDERRRRRVASWETSRQHTIVVVSLRKVRLDLQREPSWRFSSEREVIATREQQASAQAGALEGTRPQGWAGGQHQPGGSESAARGWQPTSCLTRVREAHQIEEAAKERAEQLASAIPR